MQDKYTHHTSPSSPADLGWERMAALLDAEMPVQHVATPSRSKKRGLIWLWLLAGLVIMAGTAATIYQYHRQAPEQPETPAAEGFNPAIAQLETPAEAVVSAFGKSSAPIAATSVIPPVSLAVVPALQERTATAAIPALLSAEVVDPLALSVPVETASVLDQHVVYSALQTNHWAGASAMLQAAVPSSLLGTRPDLSLEPQQKTRRNMRKKVRFGVELGTGIAAGTGGVENFSAGVVAVWKPGISVAARSGLLAGSNTGDLYIPASARRALTNDPNGVGLDNNTPLQALENHAFSGQTYRFQAVTLQLPAILSYYLSPRLSIEGGVTAGLLLNLQNVSEAADELDVLVSTGSSPTANFSQAQLSDAVSNSIARWELLASAGLRCQITPRFSIGLHYQHGLNDLLPDSSLQAMQRNVRLSGAMLF